MAFRPCYNDIYQQDNAEFLEKSPEVLRNRYVNYPTLKHGACSCVSPQFHFLSGGFGINTRYDRLFDCSPTDVLRRDVVDEPGEPA